MSIFPVGWHLKDWLSGHNRAEATGDGIEVPARSASPEGVTVAEAMSLPMVYRSIQILGIAGKQLSIETTRYGVVISDPALVRRPDPDTTRSAWIEQSIVSLASTGNAYYEIIRDAAGTPIALPVLNPLDVRIRTNRDGRITGYSYHGRDLRAADVQHITLLRIPGSAYGLGPIQAAQSDLRGAISTRDYASMWLDESAVPTGQLKTDQALTPQKAAEAKGFWNDNVGQKSGVVVLGSGLSYSPIFLSPKDVQFIESQQFNVTSIARMFGTPASLMLASVEGGSQTYQNVEQDWLAFTRFTLMGYLVEIEDALSALLPGAARARFNIEALLRADTTSRYTAYQTAIAAGFMTVNEVRAIEGLAPLGDAAPTPDAIAARMLGEFIATRAPKEINQ